MRAFDVKTGKQIWRFNTIPGPGEFGNDTWENGSWEWTGNVGVWTQISVDPTAGGNGMAYLPVETPTIDEYGGNRHGNNLFAESIVAVDLKTGVRKWHFQQVHHGLWDHDNSSASLLIDTTINGTPRKLLAQPSKQGWLYTFDRITGQPIWPIPEVGHPGTPRLYEGGKFFHPDGKARFHGIAWRESAEVVDDDYPVWLTTGRVVSQYLSGTQTRRIKALVDQYPEPLCEMHPQLAERIGVADGDLVTVTSRRGTITLPAHVVATIRPDTVFIPYHWPGRKAANNLTIRSYDPVSGIPEYKRACVKIERSVPPQ